MIHRVGEVTGSRKVYFKCNRCGKNRARVLRVTHTVNPFNKNEDGTTRTPGQVADRVHDELDRLVSTTVTCASCAREK